MTIEELLQQIADNINNVINAVRSPIDDAATGIASYLRYLREDVLQGIIGRVDTVTNQVGNVIATLTGEVRNKLDSIVSQTGDIAGAVGQAINGSVAAIASAVSDQLNATLGGVVRGIQDTVNTISGNVSGLADAIGQRIADSVTTITNFVGDARDAITTTLGNVANNLSIQVNNLGSQIGGAVTNIITAISGALDAAKNGILTTVTTIGNTINQVISDAKTAVLTQVGNIGTLITNTLGGIGDAIGKAIEALVKAIGDAIGGIAAWIGAQIQAAQHNIELLIDAFQKAIPAVVADLVGQLGNIVKALPEDFKQQIVEVAKVWGIDLSAWLNTQRQISTGRMNGLAAPLLHGAANAPGMPGDLSHALNDIAEGEGAAYSILKAMSAVGLIFSAMSTLSGVRITPAVNAIQRDIQATPLSPAETAAAYVQGYLSLDDAKSEAEYSGVDAGRMDILTSIAGEPPGLETSLTLWNRHIFTEGDVEQAIAESRLKPKYTQAVKALRYALPSPSDLVRMVVKEAFNEELAGALGLDSEYPAQVEDVFGQAGMSPEWLRRFWRAHWELPSPTQAYEMLHRGLIDRTQLEQLLRAQDFAPQWRDKLLNISFNPLTRVDVRRMHQLGVLSDAELPEQYRAAGYSPENAERLSQFTIELNNGELAAKKKPIRDLTLAQLLNAYRDKLMPRDKLLSAIEKLGYDAEESSLLVAVTDYQIADSERKEHIAAIKANFESGAITRQNAYDQLLQLGTPAWSADATLQKLDRSKRQKVKQPTEKTIHQFLLEKLISVEEAAKAFADLGYSDFWVDKFIQLEKRTLEV